MPYARWHHSLVLAPSRLSRSAAYGTSFAHPGGDAQLLLKSSVTRHTCIVGIVHRVPEWWGRCSLHGIGHMLTFGPDAMDRIHKLRAAFAVSPAPVQAMLCCASRPRCG